MIITMRPGSVTRTAGAVTWASTLATATAMPGGRPVQAAAAAVSRPAHAPSGANCSAHPRFGDIGKSRIEGGEEVARGIAPVDHHRLIASRADVARLHAGELPHDPIGGLDEALAGGIDLGVFLKNLQGFAEEPFAGVLPP